MSGHKRLPAKFVSKGMVVNRDIKDLRHQRHHCEKESEISQLTFGIIAYICFAAFAVLFARWIRRPR